MEVTRTRLGDSRDILACAQNTVSSVGQIKYLGTLTTAENIYYQTSFFIVLPFIGYTFAFATHKIGFIEM